MQSSIMWFCIWASDKLKSFLWDLASDKQNRWLVGGCNSHIDPIARPCLFSLIKQLIWIKGRQFMANICSYLKVLGLLEACSSFPSADRQSKFGSETMLNSAQAMIKSWTSTLANMRDICKSWYCLLWDCLWPPE